MRPDKGRPYYTAYEKRYRSVYEQGADRYAFLPMEEEIQEILGHYIERFGLVGKRVVEFGCGEGWAGHVLARFGCVYQGYDIAPSALEKATALLSGYAHARVRRQDVVLGNFPLDAFDAGVDVACLHMLVTDADRKKYLGNVYGCLRPGAPMYFVHLRHGDDSYEGEVECYEQWLQISGEDVDTPREMPAMRDGRGFAVMIPRIAARPRSESGYREELTKAGFEVIKFETTEKWGNVNILVRKL